MRKMKTILAKTFAITDVDILPHLCTYKNTNFCRFSTARQTQMRHTLMKCSQEEDDSHYLTFPLRTMYCLQTVEHLISLVLIEVNKNILLLKKTLTTVTSGDSVT